MQTERTGAPSGFSKKRLGLGLGVAAVAGLAAELWTGSRPDVPTPDVATPSDVAHQEKVETPHGVDFNFRLQEVVGKQDGKGAIVIDFEHSEKFNAEAREKMLKLVGILREKFPDENFRNWKYTGTDFVTGPGLPGVSFDAYKFTINVEATGDGGASFVVERGELDMDMDVAAGDMESVVKIVAVRLSPEYIALGKERQKLLEDYSNVIGGKSGLSGSQQTAEIKILRQEAKDLDNRCCVFLKQNGLGCSSDAAAFKKMMRGY